MVISAIVILSKLFVTEFLPMHYTWVLFLPHKCFWWEPTYARFSKFCLLNNILSQEDIFEQLLLFQREQDGKDCQTFKHLFHVFILHESLAGVTLLYKVINAHLIQ